jgi:hypothetical protein
MTLLNILYYEVPPAVALHFKASLSFSGQRAVIRTVFSVISVLFHTV